jgi:HEAT repeat protein
MKAISSVRDDRATPLFVFILQNVDHRGPLASVYLRAIESLGALKDAEAVKPLTEVLYKGEWWAPGRTRTLRTAAATALARIGNKEATAALEQAVANGSRGVRAAARPHLHARRRHDQGGTS